MKTNVEKQVINFSLAIKGVFGRNRTVKLTTERIAEVDKGTTEPSREELEAQVKAKLVELKVKPGAAYRLTRQEETLTQYLVGEGDNARVLESRSFMVFSGETVLQGRVE